jgi:hypothetical protein
MRQTPFILNQGFYFTTREDVFVGPFFSYRQMLQYRKLFVEKITLFNVCPKQAANFINDEVIENYFSPKLLQ